MKRRALKRKKKGNWGWLKWFGLAVLLLITGYSVFFFQTKYWNSNGKLAVVESYGLEVLISLFDSKASNYVEIIIPGNTQVLTAYGLGTWKLGSLWKLGTDEKIGGSLITRTVAKNFGFPVFIWQDALSIGDKLRIGIFKFTNRNNKETIFLKETACLKKTVFLDGEEGYLVNNDVPEKISSLFSDQKEFGNVLNAKIIDYSGSYNISNSVGTIIETMGIKVASISKNSGFGSDCKVLGKNRGLVKKVALLLGCSQTEVKESGVFDLEISLGKKFVQQF